MVAKRFVSTVFALTLGLGLLAVGAVPALAVNADTLLSGPDTLSNSGDAAELQYIKDVTGNDDLIDLGRDDSPTVQTDGTIDWIANIPDGTLFFKLKFGNGLDNFFAFQNVPELDIAAWLRSDVNGLTNLSHLNFYGVPIPGALLLMLSGLASLFGLRWWRNGRGQAKPAAT